MNIIINKDIESEYRSEFIRGYSTKEVIMAGIAIAVVFAITGILYLKADVPPTTGVYVGIVPAFVIIFFAFRKYQNLTLFEYLREIMWERQTQILAYDAGDVPEPDFVVPLKLPPEPKQKHKKRRQAAENISADISDEVEDE